MGAVKDLPVEELERLIERVARRTLDEYREDLAALASREDLAALASREYLASIREAREDYQAGRVTKLADKESE